jgi:hypothetical protein
VAITSGSFWKPSRGPTSLMRTLVTAVQYANGRRADRGEIAKPSLPTGAAPAGARGPV